MLKSELLTAFRMEIDRHDFSHFVNEPPSAAQGGKGVVVPSCPMCRKRFGTMPQVLDHLTDDVLPAVLDRLSAENVGGAGRIRTDKIVSTMRSCPHIVPTLYPKPGKTDLSVPIAVYSVLPKPLAIQPIARGLWHYESAALTAELRAPRKLTP